MELTTAPQSELIRIIYEQQDQIKVLLAQIAELRSRLKDQGHKDKEPLPSWVKPNVKKKRKTVRKNRSQGFGRKLDTPTKQIFHSCDTCPSCGGENLGKPSVSYTRQTIDIPPVTVEVTEHVVFKRWCANCCKQVAPQLDLAGAIVGQQRFGVRLMSMVAMFKEAFRQPVATIQSYFEILHNLHLSRGEIITLLHKTATRGKHTYEGLQQQLRKNHVVYGDETGGRENGRNGYTWNFNTDTIKFLLYRHTRSQTVVTEVLGDDFEGVLVSDFYAAYNVYAGFHQRCWVHYLRDVKKLKELYPKDIRLRQWTNQIHKLYQQAKEWSGPSVILPKGTREHLRIKKQQEFEEKLKNICEPWITQEVPMSTLSARAIKFLPEMFTFIRFEGIASDNNSAERSIRHDVISRKISGGTRSAKGSETKSILGSLFGTWKLQNLNPFEQCKLLLTQG
jgi:transposase